MANQMQVTVYAIGGLPQPSTITLSFPTKDIIVQEITSPITGVNSQLTYYPSPNSRSQAQEFLIGETVAACLTSANTFGTSMIEATIRIIGTSPLKEAKLFLFPADKPSIWPSGEGEINSFVLFNGIKYYAEETEADLVTAANAGGGGGGTWDKVSYQNDAMSSPVDAYVQFGSGSTVAAVFEPIRNNYVRIHTYDDMFPFDNSNCFDNTINDVDFQNIASDVVMEGCTLETMVINGNSHTGLQLIRTRLTGTYAVGIPNDAELYLTGNAFRLQDCSFGAGSYFNSNGDVFAMGRSTGGSNCFFNFNGATNTSVVDSTFGDSSYFEMIDGIQDSVTFFDIHFCNSSGIDVNGSGINITGCQLNEGAYLVTNGICRHSTFDTYTEVTVDDGSVDYCSFGVGVEITVTDAKVRTQFENIAGTVYQLGVTDGAVTATPV